MSLLGKILAFLNILGAAAFVSLAAMDYAKRQAWEYANFRHDLTNHGLPVNATETDKFGQVIADRISDNTKKDLFPFSPVTSQVEEVDRVRGLLQGPLGEAAQDPTQARQKQLVLYATYLRPLARSNAERERLFAILQYLKDPAREKKLKSDLEKGIRPALEIMRLDLNPKKRSFPEAYAEALQHMGDEPRDPFVDALLKVLPREGKTFQQAFDAAIAGEMAGMGMGKSLQELFLQALRGEANKKFAELFNAAYDEALELRLADWKQQFDSYFVEAKDRKRRLKDGTSPELLSPEEQKRAIAHLLLNLAEVLPQPAPAPGQPAPGQPAAPTSVIDNEPYRRVLTVVGLRAAGKALDTQAQALSEVADELRLALSREGTTFALAHQDLLNQIKDRATHVDVQDAARQRVKEMADAKEKIIVRRNVDVEYYKTEFAAVRKELLERLKELREMSAELYNIRLTTRQDTELNQAYEREIGRLEERVRPDVISKPLAGGR